MYDATLAETVTIRGDGGDVAGAAAHLRALTSSKHPGRFKRTDHARAALHDRRERRHMRIELGFKPDLTCQIGIGEIGHHGAPNREVDEAARLRRHRLHHWHRQRQRIAMCKWSVHADKRRTKACGQPNRWFIG